MTWDPWFPRLTSMIDGTGTRQYSCVPVGSLGARQFQHESDPLASSAIISAYDEFGRLSQRTVQGVGAESTQAGMLCKLESSCIPERHPQKAGYNQLG